MANACTTHCAGSAQSSVGMVGSGSRERLSFTGFTTMPTLLWAEPAQCVVHAFAINVPQNLHVGYITAESEPVPDALRMLGVQVDLLDAKPWRSATYLS